MESTIDNKLKQLEEEAIKNKQAYINLNENDKTVDITDNLYSFINDNLSIDKKISISASDFKLAETMGASQFNNYKMDSHYKYKETSTYNKYIKNNLIKPLNFFNAKDIENIDNAIIDIISIMDNLLIKEAEWLNGGSCNQTIFSLLYFHSKYGSFDFINSNSEIHILNSYLNSYKHIAYIYNYIISKCSSIRDEEFVPNFEKLKQDYNNLDTEFNLIIKYLKDNKQKFKNKNFIEAVVLRFNFRHNLLKTLNYIIETKKLSPDNLKSLILDLKNTFEKLKPTLNTNYFDNYNNNVSYLKLTTNYFNPNITKIIPPSFVAKSINNLSLEETTVLFDKLITNMEDIELMYSISDYFSIKKRLQTFSNSEPVLMLRGLMEYILYPKSINEKDDNKKATTQPNKRKRNKIFKEEQALNSLENSKNNIDINNLVFLNNVKFTDMLFNFIPEYAPSQTLLESKNPTLMQNLYEVFKEILINQLRIKSKRNYFNNEILGALFVLVAEINNSIEVNNSTEYLASPLSVFPNFLKKFLLHEVIEYININLELDLISIYEYDYIFYVIKSLLESVCQTLDFLLSKFAKKVLKEHDYLNSLSKKKFTFTQKMLIDELQVLNGFKFGYTGLCLLLIYVKKNKIYKGYYDSNVSISSFNNNNIDNAEQQAQYKEAERIFNRFNKINGFEMLGKVDYKSFITFREGVANMDILSLAENMLKNSEDMFKQLKSADIKLRNALYYNNEFLANNIKSIMFNRLLIGKLKKGNFSGENCGCKGNINFKKYNSSFPLFELNK